MIHCVASYDFSVFVGLVSVCVVPCTLRICCSLDLILKGLIHWGKFLLCEAFLPQRSFVLYIAGLISSDETY